MKSLMAKNQRDYIISHTPNRLLEYGSGGSTLYFADHIKHVVSVEHSKKWYDKLSELSPSNHTYLLMERSLDGKFDEESPMGLEVYLGYETHPVDSVLIDGVARGACLALCYHRYPQANIFLHDSQRKWYDWAVKLYPNVEVIEADEGDYPPQLLRLCR